MEFINWHGHESVMAYSDTKLEKVPESLSIQGKDYKVLDANPQPLASTPKYKYVYLVTIEVSRANPYK